jgi:hypothetical protein
MSPKKLIIALWAVVALVALAIVLAPSNDGYREFASTQVAPANKAIVPAADKSVATSQAAASVAPAADSKVTVIREAGAPAFAFNGVAQAMTPAAAPAKVAPTPLAQTKPADASGRTASTVFRSAPLASAAEHEEAAVAAGGDRQHFLTACRHDHDLYLAASGNKPFYVCRGLKAPVGPNTTEITTTPTYPTTQTFLLHSRPGATRKVYLDFTGHTTTGTPWNWPAPTGWGVASFTTPPFSLDADTANVSIAEHTAIQTVWRRIAEDFAGYDVDVTTEDPGLQGLLRTSAGDLNYGMRVIFGPDQNATGAGGVAYVTSYGFLRAAGETDIPCFVFADTGATAKFMSEAGSHEVGHTVGLFHDGTNAVEYFQGHGTGAGSWAPIMGVGYSREVVQWSKGDYTAANNTQDDLAVIGTYIPVVVDEFGETTAAATAVTGLSAEVGGIIATTADVDTIRINAGRGDLVITPKVALSSPNLRLQVKVLDSTGATLGTYVGAGTVGNMAPGPITLNLPAEGFYYIQLEGVANGTGATDGYPDYASTGYYSFTATWAELGNKRPIANATLSATTTYHYVNQPTAMVNFNGTQSTDPDGVIVRYIWDFKDQYPAGAVGATATHRYKAPGTYFPTLTVVDDLGASATTTVTVTVNGPVRNPTCSLALINGAFVRLNSIHDAANATILVQDQYGNPVRRALVYVTTSGLVAMKRTALRTDDLGRVNVSTPGFRRGARGSVIFTVATVESPGRPFVNVGVAPVTVAAPTVTLTR